MADTKQIKITAKPFLDLTEDIIELKKAVKKRLYYDLSNNPCTTVMSYLKSIPHHLTHEECIRNRGDY